MQVSRHSIVSLNLSEKCQESDTAGDYNKHYMVAVREIEGSQRLEAFPSSQELERRIQRSIGTIVAQQHPESFLYPAATADHYDGKHYYDHFWVRDGAVVATKLFETEDERAKESATKAMQGIFRLFAGEEYEKGFGQRPTLKDGIMYINPQDTPPMHRNLDGSYFYWHGRNQPDSFSEFLIAVRTARDKNVTLGEDGSPLSASQQKTLEAMTNYLLELNIWQFDCSSMWENETVHNPTPLSTVAIVAKGLEDIRPLLPESYNERIDQYVATARQVVFENFPVELTELHHPGRYDLATLVAFDLGALDFLGTDAYLEYRERALKETELGYKGIPGGMRRFRDDAYYARLTDGSINTEPLSDTSRIRKNGEAVWFMAIPMDIKMLTKVIPEVQQRDPQYADQLVEILQKRVAYMEFLNEQCSYRNPDGHFDNMYPELFTPTFDGTPPIMNNNNLLWNHAAVIGALAQVRDAFYPSQAKYLRLISL